MSANDLIRKLSSIRLSFRKQVTVIYKAPGFLHGTYMLQKRGGVCHTDLVRHAIEMRFGAGHENLVADGVRKIAIEIQSIEQ